MSGKLTARVIRILLLELDCAEKYRGDQRIHADCIASVREILLSAALGDVAVETEEKS